MEKLGKKLKEIFLEEKYEVTYPFIDMIIAIFVLAIPLIVSNISLSVIWFCIIVLSEIYCLRLIVYSIIYFIKKKKNN